MYLQVLYTKLSDGMRVSMVNRSRVSFLPLRHDPVIHKRLTHVAFGIVLADVSASEDIPALREYPMSKDSCTSENQYQVTRPSSPAQ